ncbi:CcmD family protein [Sphingobacterium corticis]|uniref:CcmD family protein n=1 Tax=Sphingobacterium corticis TaxID=1812823 RepID=A0ABW5NLG2_9SPHI
MKKHLITIISLLAVVFQASAQSVEMATGLRSEGKIYVVIAVMLVIFLGVAAYLFSIDSRVKKLERKK